MAGWCIRGFDGLNEVFVQEIPDYSEKEILGILQRLCCQTLSHEEIVMSSLRNRGRGRRTLLERIGTGQPLTVGVDPTFTAEKI